MSGDSWYARYPGDYRRDTAHLSLVQHGAYTLCLDHYYATGRPLPSARDLIYRICSAFEEGERLAVDFVLENFFRAQPDGYHNSRADRELVEREAKRKQQSEAARKRWGSKTGEHPTSSDAFAHAYAHANAIARPQPQPQRQSKPGANAAPMPSHTDPGCGKELADRRKIEARDRREKFEAVAHVKSNEARREALNGSGPEVQMTTEQRKCWDSKMQLRHELYQEFESARTTGEIAKGISRDAWIHQRLKERGLSLSDIGKVAKPEVTAA